MVYQTVKLEISGALATITLNRPEKLNAISTGMIDDLLTALSEVEGSSAHVLILTGAGKAFCSGMDLEDLKAVATRSPEEHLSGLAPHGEALPATLEFSETDDRSRERPGNRRGCGLATLCDFTISAADATFGYPEVRIGFIPAIVSVFLTRQIGEKTRATCF